MVASKSALVAFIFTATPINWIISPASGPTICAPITRLLIPSTTSFMNMRVSRPDSVAFIGDGSNIIFIDYEHDIVAVVRWIDGGKMKDFVRLLLAAQKGEGG